MLLVALPFYSDMQVRRVSGPWQPCLFIRTCRSAGSPVLGSHTHTPTLNYYYCGFDYIIVILILFYFVLIIFIIIIFIYYLFSFLLCRYYLHYCQLNIDFFFFFFNVIGSLAFLYRTCRSAGSPVLGSLEIINRFIDFVFISSFIIKIIKTCLIVLFISYYRFYFYFFFFRFVS